MRTIKFRGKSVETGKWVFGDVYTDIYFGDVYIHEVSPDCGGETFLADKDTIGQFTGLKDKNGNEIYEGDVISWKSKCYVVVFRDGMFYASVEEYNTGAYGGYPLHAVAKTATTIDGQDICEIVGNIHNIKEMLKHES